MSLIHPQGHLVYYPPEYDGFTTVFGLSRDWRPDKDWHRAGLEWIDPLRAFAPAGAYRPVAMDLDDWDVGGNELFREIVVAGNPAVQWLQFYDGAAHTWTDDEEDVYGVLRSGADADGWMPRFCLWLKRQTPAPGAQVTPQVSVVMQALTWDGSDWVEGRVGLYLPLQGDADSDASNRFDTAMLVHATLTEAPADEFWDIWTAGRILSQGPRGPAASNRLIEEGWLFEYEEVWLDSDGTLWAEDDGTRAFQQSFILIRHVDESMGDWWVYASDTLRLTTGQYGTDPTRPTLSITCAGAIAALNCCWVVYGGVDGRAVTNRALTLGHAGIETTDTWGTLYSQATGWTVGTTNHAAYAAAGMYGPEVTTQRQWLYAYAGTEPWNIRPIIWDMTEDHAATVTPQGGTTYTTTDHDDLRAISYTLNDTWKGASGTAEFYPTEEELHPTWRPNGALDVYLGWQEDAGADFAEAQVARAYIEADGIKRRSEAGETSGPYHLSLRFGDLAATRLQTKAIIDMRQAGGMTVGDWASLVANRVGLVAGQLAVDAAVENQVIPLAEIPSTPNLEATDGSSWLSHIQAVENAADIRVGFDASGMFVDAGSPEYEDGVSEIAFSLDDTSVTPEDIVYSLDADCLGSNFRNVLKATWGRDDKRSTYYWVEAEVDRLEGIGDDWPVVITDDDARYPGDIGARFNREHYDTQQGAIRWEGPCRPELLPDQFVSITSASGVGVEVYSVYRITQVTHSMDAEAFDAATTVEAVLVYPVDTGADE
jgi:hypothetical protein